LELQLVGYIYGLLIIKDGKWKWMFWGITPWLLLIIPPSIINFWDLLLEYILSLYIFTPFLFWNQIIKIVKKKSIPIEMLLFSSLITLLMILKLFIHTLAGVLWWIPNNWYGSFIFNLPIYGVTLAFVLSICIIIYRPMTKMMLEKQY
jgi:hypothetical protein